MADSVSVSNTGGQLSCSICQRQISEMILSSCFHTFCPHCLHGNASRSARTGQYECPICQTPITLPKNSKLHTDLVKMGRERTIHTERRREWTAHRAVSTRASTQLGDANCDVCGHDTPATNHCLICDETFCDACTNAHLKMKVSRYHGDQVVPVGGDRDGVQTPADGDEPVEKYCPRHVTHEILFVCKQCGVMVCNICKLMEHEHHVTRLVSEEADTIREQLHTLLEEQHQQLDTIQSRLHSLQEKQQQYPADLENEIEKVRKQATRVHMDIDREKMDKERELEEHYSQYMDKATMSRQSLSQDYEQRAALVRQAEQILDTEEDLRFIQTGPTVCKQLQSGQATASALNLDKDDQPYKRFVPKSINSKSQPLVGIITTDDRKHLTPVKYSQNDRITSPIKTSPSKPVAQTKPPTAQKKTTKQTAVHASTPPAVKSSSPKQASPVVKAATKKKSQNPPISPKTYVSTPPLLVNNNVRTESHQETTNTHPIRSPSPPFEPPTNIQSEPIKLTKVSNFTIQHNDLSGYIYGIAPVAGQDQAWVSMLDHNRIVLVDKDGHISNAADLGEPCEGVTSDTNGGCYVTCPGSKTLYYVTNTGHVHSVVTNLALHPHGMAGWQYYDNRRDTMIEELFVCFTDSRKAAFYERPKGSIGVFSFFGQDLGKGFTMGSPVRIDVDLPTNMMCISDHMNSCVMICDKSGKYTTALYTGQEDQDLFKPLGVCFDDTSHVIVADWTGSKVSRVSIDGRLVQDLITDVDGPQSVAMSDNGLLWVGAKKGKVFVYNTK